MKIGVMNVETNYLPYKTASKLYHQVLVINDVGEFETLLITDKELARMRERLSKNDEDKIIPGWFDRLVTWFVRRF